MKPIIPIKANQPIQYQVIISFLLLAFIPGIFSCNPSSTQAQSSETSTLPPRDSVRNGLWESGSVAIIYPEESAFLNDYMAWAEGVQKNSRYLTISVFGDKSVPDSILHHSPLLIVGTEENNQLLEKWLPSTPISPTRSGFMFQGTEYEEENQSVFLSWYPHPINQNMPISILTGNSDQAITAMMGPSSRRNGMGIGFGNWDYQIYEGKDKRLIGNYTNDWHPDQHVRWEFDPRAEPILRSTISSIYLHEVENKELAQAIADSIQTRKTRFSKWLGQDIPSIPLEIHLYGHPETMGLSVGEMETGWRENNTIHRIVHPEFIHQDPGLEWAAWMNQTIGKPSVQILEDGLRTWMIPNFQRLGYKSLGASLLRAEGNQAASVMFDPNAYQRESPLVRDCYAGIFVDFLLKYWGKEEFLQRYADLGTEPADDSLSQAWIKYQTELSHSVPVRAQWGALPDFHKGMTFAHEGYQVYNGYGSRQAEKALQHLSTLGTNAMAIVPYTGTSNPQSSEPLRWSRGAGGENDASVILSHFGTKEAGMITMLKPQVWVRGGWPGDVDMADEAEWERWFDHYHRWIRHYAVLAEIHQMDVLCLGTEFRYATMKHPARWRDLVTRIRHIYHGTITYAANWGEETENLEFADALDFVGINFYYPLSNADAPTDEQLLEKMEKTLSSLDKLSSQWGKPYVLTEIGYRSITAPWKHPHAEAGNAGVSELDQARCYQAVFTALPNHPACRGLYWWKWPSYEQYAHRNPVSFTPCGKEAEALLKSAYLRQ